MIEPAFAHERAAFIHGRHRRRIHLAADPIRLLDDQHGRAQPGRLDGGAETARAGPGDDDIVAVLEAGGRRAAIFRMDRERADEEQGGDEGEAGDLHLGSLENDDEDCRKKAQDEQRKEWVHSAFVSVSLS